MFCMKRWKWVIFAVVPIAVLAVFLRKPIRNLYVDLTFPLTEHTETEQRVHDYAKANGVRYSAYPASLIALLERNPETESFVLNYPFRESWDGDMSGFSRDTVPLMLQWDPRWGYEKYGSDMLAITGCGPTSLAMAGYYLTGDASFNPASVAAFSRKNGYYASGYGSSWTLISEGGIKLGLRVTELPLVKKKMVSALEAGHPVILALGPGDFTTSGHYIVLTGIEDGAFRVNDPNSRERSGRLWTYEELEPQIRNIWEISTGGTN